MFIEEPKFMRHMDYTSRLPPLGILYIAAYLQSRTDHEVKILDAPLENFSYDAIENRIREFSPDVVGVTTYTTSLLDTLEIVRRAKRVNPETFVVLGGPHVFLYPTETAMLPEVDAIVPSEGEEVMTDLVEALAKRTPLEKVAGICFKRNGEIVTTPPRGHIADLDSLPFPARSLMSLDAYKFVTDHNIISTIMISSRGCRFNCIFCDIPFRFIRARSPENVVREMIECAEMGYREINFYDDNFNYNEERVAKICKEIIKHGSPVTFSIRARVDKINEEMADLLYRAGCRRISFGVESGDNETLKYLKKGITTEMTRRAVRISKDAGIEIAAYFMIAIPGRPKEDSLRTIDFAIELEIDYAQFIAMHMMPGTKIYADALKAGAFDHDFFLDFARNPAPTSIDAYWENPLSIEEAKSLTKLAYRRFYLRPSYIWKRLKEVQSFSELIRKSYAGLDVFSYAFRNKPTFQRPSK